jgi:hypothetical protein
MDKKLLEHEKFIKDEIEKFNRQLKDVKNKEEAELVVGAVKNLNDYHQKTVRDFQHERLIHLIVTLFFISVSLLSVGTLVVLPVIYESTIMSMLVLCICLILFITDIFYVRHYYKLENGTQRLYGFSKGLYDMIGHY